MGEPMVFLNGKWQPLSMLTAEERRQLGIASDHARRALLAAIVALGIAAVSLSGTVLLWLCSMVQ